MMVPKTYAALSDALDEGCAHAATKAIEIISEQYPTSSGSGPAHDAVAEAIRSEVLNAISERFHFEEPSEP